MSGAAYPLPIRYHCLSLSLEQDKIILTFAKAEDGGTRNFCTGRKRNNKNSNITAVRKETGSHVWCIYFRVCLSDSYSALTAGPCSKCTLGYVVGFCSGFACLFV
jgi:hypothetical protein